MPLTNDNVEFGYPYVTSASESGRTLQFFVSAPVSDYTDQALSGATETEAANAAFAFAPGTHEHGSTTFAKNRISRINNVSDLEDFVSYSIEIEYGHLRPGLPPVPPVPTGTKTFSWAISLEGRTEQHYAGYSFYQGWQLSYSSFLSRPARQAFL